MAEKKENKAIGNLVIAVIPLIGIIWASIAGIQHSGYVKDVEKAEKVFDAQGVKMLSSEDIAQF